MLPILALLMFGLLETAAVIRDVLVVHEAARAGVRTAATTTGVEAPTESAREAAVELELNVTVEPASRSDGDLVTVTTSAQRSIGPFTHTVRAEAVAMVEPAVGADATNGQGAGSPGEFGAPP